MSSPSLRKRGGKKEALTHPPENDFSTLPRKTAFIRKPRAEWDYRLAVAILTALAFITRFYKISYPSEVVFDEVHFGKVCV